MKVAIVGMGTVGNGVLKIIQENKERIEALINDTIEVTHIFSRTVHNYLDLDFSDIEHIKPLDELYAAPVDVVIETMGGTDLAFDIAKRFLSQGIFVISANKDMLALYIDELAKIGNEHHAQLRYEASCAGGIPMVNALEAGLAANHTQKILGIVNGTSNFILSQMMSHQIDYKEALKDAQKKGYAEAEPTSDVAGIDAARKITLLSRLAYNECVNLADVPKVGLSQVTTDDISYANENNFVLKPIAYSEYHQKKLYSAVTPALLAGTHKLANINGVDNAVLTHGDMVGDTLYSGPGAGSLATGSAVIADLITIGRFGFTGNLQPASLSTQIPGFLNNTRYYIRTQETQQEVREYLSKHQVNYTTENDKLVTSPISYEVYTNLPITDREIALPIID